MIASGTKGRQTAPEAAGGLQWLFAFAMGLCPLAVAATDLPRGALLGAAAGFCLLAGACGMAALRRRLPAWCFLPILFLLCGTAAYAARLAVAFCCYPWFASLEAILPLAGVSVAVLLSAREIALSSRRPLAALRPALVAAMGAWLFLAAVGTAQTLLNAGRLGAPVEAGGYIALAPPRQPFAAFLLLGLLLALAAALRLARGRRS